MTIEQHIQQLNNNGTSREKDRRETYESIREMEITLSVLVVEIHSSLVVVTQ